MNTSIQTKRAFLLLFFCILSLNAAYAFAQDTQDAQENNKKDELVNLWSLDSDVFATARRNLGYGVGLKYERKLNDKFSIMPGFGHMVFFADITTVIVGLQLNLFYYPFNKGLDMLYIGFGNGCDFIMYPQEDDMEDDVAFSLIPTLGYKIRVRKHLMIEPHIGWRLYPYVTSNNSDVDNYLNEGFQYGIGFKFFITRRALYFFSRRNRGE